MEPKPCKELVSCGVEIILDKLVVAEERNPIEPKPTSEDCKILLLSGASPLIVDVKSVSVLRDVARKSGKSRKPSPDPNIRLSI